MIRTWQWLDPDDYWDDDPDYDTSIHAITRVEWLVIHADDVDATGE